LAHSIAALAPRFRIVCKIQPLTQGRNLLFRPLARVRFNAPHRLADCPLRGDHHQQGQMSPIVLHLHELQLWVVRAQLSQAVTPIRPNPRSETLPPLFTHQHQVLLTGGHTLRLLAIFHPPTIPSQEDAGSSSSPTPRSGFYPQIKGRHSGEALGESEPQVGAG
jgi:hypothetical protein